MIWFVIQLKQTIYKCMFRVPGKLVGGFNPFEKMLVKDRGEHKNIFKKPIL